MTANWAGSCRIAQVFSAFMFTIVKVIHQLPLVGQQLNSTSTFVVGILLNLLGTGFMDETHNTHALRSPLLTQQHKVTLVPTDLLRYLEMGLYSQMQASLEPIQFIKLEQLIV